MSESLAGGPLSLLPSLTVLGLAVLTRRPLEALIAGSLVGYGLLSGAGFAASFLEGALRVMAEPASGWVILVVSLFGALIGVLARSGGSQAFGAALSRRLRTPRSLLFGAFGLGLVTFVDDYLNALAVGSAFRSAADRLRVSRARLAYVVDSTAAPVCVLAPVSTWAVFLAALFEERGLAAAGAGVGLYVSLIPFFLYPWFALLGVLLHLRGPGLGFSAMAASERAARAGRPAARRPRSTSRCSRGRARRRRGGPGSPPGSSPGRFSRCRRRRCSSTATPSSGSSRRWGSPSCSPRCSGPAAGRARSPTAPRAAWSRWSIRWGLSSSPSSSAM